MVYWRLTLIRYVYKRGVNLIILNYQSTITLCCFYEMVQMGSRNEDVARRFLALVDEFYERKVKLIINADVEMSEIYQGQFLRFEYQRCLSRLQEMQSEEYLSQPHLA